MILRTLLNTKLQSECSGLPIAKCSSTSFIQERICPQWLISKGDRQMLQRSNFKIRLLVGCDGLEWDASRFRGGERSPTCKLCHSAAEDAIHFLLVCPALQSTREMLLSSPPPPHGNAVCIHLLSKPANRLLARHILAQWPPNPKIHSELHTRAQKSPCRPDYAINDITTTLPNKDTLLSVEARNTKKKKWTIQIWAESFLRSW